MVIKQNRETVFKQCTCCDFIWPTRADFFNDPTVEIQAYQARAEKLAGLFLFDHKVCGTSLAIPAEKLKDLYGGRLYEECRLNTKETRVYVQRLKDEFKSGNLPL
ncbi:MAG: hypothetical protein ABII88_04590 [Candidatus Omnitrophota bacterium]